MKIINFDIEHLKDGDLVFAPYCLSGVITRLFLYFEDGDDNTKLLRLRLDGNIYARVELYKDYCQFSRIDNISDYKILKLTYEEKISFLNILINKTQNSAVENRIIKLLKNLEN